MQHHDSEKNSTDRRKYTEKETTVSYTIIFPLTKRKILLPTSWAMKMYTV